MMSLQHFKVASQKTPAQALFFVCAALSIAIYNLGCAESDSGRVSRGSSYRFSDNFVMAHGAASYNDAREEYISVHDVSPEVAEAMRTGTVLHMMSASEVVLTVGNPTTITPVPSTGGFELHFRGALPYQVVSFSREGRVIEVGIECD